MQIALCVLVGLIGAIEPQTGLDTLSADARAYVQAGLACQIEEISKLTARLATATSKMNEARRARDYATSRKLIAKRKELSEQLEALKASKPPRPRLALTALAVDAIGVPDVSELHARWGWHLEVLEVVGPHEMFVACCYAVPESTHSSAPKIRGTAAAFRATHPVPGKTVREPVIKIVGVSTRDVTTGRQFSAAQPFRIIGQPFRVIGTTTYPTATGTRTVFVLEKLELGDFQPGKWFRE